MKLKNLNNYTHQELTDIITQVKAYLQVSDEDMTTITLVNYQEQTDDEQEPETHYEIYESNIDIEEESTYNEVMEQAIRNENLVKTYKTKKGLLQAMLNDKDIEGSRYRIHKIL